MITIDQAKINAPGFPRSQEWWTRFLPSWVTGTVNPDGTVTIEPSDQVTRYSPDRGLYCEPAPDKRAAATIRRHREQGIFKWLYRLPQLEPAIVEDACEPCKCWRYPAALHSGHCCFDGAKPARICHSMPADMRGPATQPLTLVAAS